MSATRVRRMRKVAQLRTEELDRRKGALGVAQDAVRAATAAEHEAESQAKQAETTRDQVVAAGITAQEFLDLGGWVVTMARRAEQARARTVEALNAAETARQAVLAQRLEVERIDAVLGRLVEQQRQMEAREERKLDDEAAARAAAERHP